MQLELEINDHWKVAHSKDRSGGKTGALFQVEIICFQTVRFN